MAYSNKFLYIVTMGSKAKILIIDDSESFQMDISLHLEDNYDVLQAFGRAEGLSIIQQDNIDLVLLDLFFKNSTDGLTILKDIKRVSPSLPVIMITDYSSVETAVKAMQLGALDYISKTPDMNRLKLLIEKALTEQIRHLQKETLQEETERPFRQIVGVSDEIERVREQIKLFAPMNNPVLIIGETGTGKELVARQLHTHGLRSKEPFIPLNCAALPETLIESELFGYEKGAFSGASKRKLGKFEIAGNGTLFLDEVSRLSPDAQMKLLRILQENEFQRLGGNEIIQSQCRIVAASNEPLIELVAQGKFRDDLYYRLNVLNITIPPVRKRKRDIKALVSYLSQQICADLKRPVPELTPEAIERLKTYNWPGNVREIQNVLTRTYILNWDQSRIDAKALSPCMMSPGSMQQSLNTLPTPHTMEEFLQIKEKYITSLTRKLERRFIAYLMERFEGNISSASRFIGLSRTSFYKMMERCGYQLSQDFND